MDVYRQASEIVRIVRAGNGTAKALCLRKEMQKKKQTYAVVCETLRHYELLQDVLEQAEFFAYYPRADRDLAMCMAYDVVIGKGVNTQQNATAVGIQKSAPYLREAYWCVKNHHVIPPRVDYGNLEDDGEPSGAPKGDDCGGSGNSNGAARSAAARISFPRYARVNTLKIDAETLVERLTRAKRRREEDAGVAETQSHGATVRKPGPGLPEFTRDPVIPSLLVFPPNTDLHAHPAVRSGQLILQDRASCLPACVLLDAVHVVTTFPAAPADGKKPSSNKLAAPKPIEYVIDACAAPGNKTTQLAALGAPGIKLMAIERDEKRAQLLERRVHTLGAADYVNVVHQDFFDLSSDDRDAAEAILLDPSCSASGVVTRVDVAMQLRSLKNKLQEGAAPIAKLKTTHSANLDVGLNDEVPADEAVGVIVSEERIEKLARVQKKLLTHALLSFQHCRRVVYSTCSINVEENEDVVRHVLADERVQARGWYLSNIMPDSWSSRGIKQSGDAYPLDHTIRCDPEVDRTNGFYVARFDRVVKAAPAARDGTTASDTKSATPPSNGTATPEVAYEKMEKRYYDSTDSSSSDDDGGDGTFPRAIVHPRTAGLCKTQQAQTLTSDSSSDDGN